MKPFVTFCLIVVASPFACGDEPDRAAVDFFEEKIRPVLIAKCFECHSAKAAEVQGGLMLDNRASIARGGDSGAVIIAGQPDASLLIEAIRYDDDAPQMPPKEKLAASTIANFEHWIRLGAPDPRDGKALDPPDSIQSRARRHWAFQPVREPDAQATVDSLVCRRLKRSNIAPAPPADLRAQARRLYFDLTGLPPTFGQTEAFVRDPTDASWQSMVDELLASPHFGERWARHWLDVARFGDTKGYVFREDRNYPNAFKYRDWVIRALNDDLPFDKFLKLQIAADHFTEKDDRRHLAALGYLTLGRRFLNNKHDIIDDRIDVVFRGMMGLTVGCARCHDHKYDPVPTEDYYSLYAVFLSSREQQDDDLPLRLVDADRPTNVRVFLRGQPGNRGDEVPRRFLTFFAQDPAATFARGSGREKLAAAIASPDNPLTARVFANRVWGHLFGKGLVETPSDFGLRSEPPLNGELLDHLAGTLQRRNSMKKLIREIVTSHVYRQSSHAAGDALAADPENLLLSRAVRRRLDFEATRDSALAVSGQLDSTVGGPSARITDAKPTTRRTLYAFIDRQNLPSLFRTFDFASPDTHAPGRPETTVPQQALFLMNNPFMQSAASQLVERIGDGADDERIRRLYRTVFSRDPTANEVTLGRRFVADRDTTATPGPRTWEYGYGSFEATSSVAWHSLPHFTGSAWQGGAELPDPKLGWVIVNAGGGHPGNDQAHSAIRRWHAPADGVIRVSGKLTHPAAVGDGVRSRVIGPAGVSGEWVATNGSVDTTVSRVEVKRGDTIDFMTDCRTNPTHDSFQWTVTIEYASGVLSGATGRWQSVDGFRGPGQATLGVWARYAQALMLTNEFVFLD